MHNAAYNNPGMRFSRKASVGVRSHTERTPDRANMLGGVKTTKSMDFFLIKILAVRDLANGHRLFTAKTSSIIPEIHELCQPWLLERPRTCTKEKLDHLYFQVSAVRDIPVTVNSGSHTHLNSDQG
jgi:hypothetical protein